MAQRQYVVMMIAKEKYGVDVQQVKSIEKMMPITKVPQTVPYIKGVVNLRGVVTPVIDLRERFGFTGGSDDDADVRIAVVQVDEMQVGMVVDAVSDVMSVNEQDIEPAPAVVGGVQAVYLRGVARVNNQLYILLNLDKILSDTQASQLREVEKSVHG